MTYNKNCRTLLFIKFLFFNAVSTLNTFMCDMELIFILNSSYWINVPVKTGFRLIQVSFYIAFTVCFCRLFGR
jgi:hypothetical protein